MRKVLKRFTLVFRAGDEGILSTLEKYSADNGVTVTDALRKFLEAGILLEKEGFIIEPKIIRPSIKNIKL